MENQSNEEIYKIIKNERVNYIKSQGRVVSEILIEKWDV